MNSSQGVYLDENGNIIVSGRWGQDPETGGIYLPTDADPELIGGYSAMISEAKNIGFPTVKSLGVITGSAITCRSASAGATEYIVNNNYDNRIACKCAEGGYIALNEAEAIAGNVAKVLSVELVDGSPLVVDSSLNPSGAEKRIKITVDKTINPDSATTSIRIYGIVKGYSNLAVGAGVAQTTRGSSLNVGGLIINQGQYDIIAGYRIVNLEADGINPLGNAMFGQKHINNGKRYVLVAGQNNDVSDGVNCVVALGEFAKVNSKTRLALGNGTGTGPASRSNVFEVTQEVKDEGLETETKYSGIIVTGANGSNYKIYIDDTGALTTELII